MTGTSPYRCSLSLRASFVPVERGNANLCCITGGSGERRAGTHGDFVDGLHVRQDEWTARLVNIGCVEPMELILSAGPGEAALGGDGEASVGKAVEIQRLRYDCRRAAEQDTAQVECFGDNAAGEYDRTKCLKRYVARTRGARPRCRARERHELL